MLGFGTCIHLREIKGQQSPFNASSEILFGHFMEPRYLEAAEGGGTGILEYVVFASRSLRSQTYVEIKAGGNTHT